MQNSYCDHRNFDRLFAHITVSSNRTNIFMKEQKQYSNLVVVITLVVFLILGAYTWTPVPASKVLLDISCTATMVAYMLKSAHLVFCRFRF
jgi:hypothetical protein